MSRLLFAFALFSTTLPVLAEQLPSPRAVGEGDSTQTVEVLSNAASVSIDAAGALDAGAGGLDRGEGRVAVGIDTPLGGASAGAGIGGDSGDAAAPAGGPPAALPASPAMQDEAAPVVPGGAVAATGGAGDCLLPVGSEPGADAIARMRAFRLLRGCAGAGTLPADAQRAVAEHPLLAGWLERNALGPDAISALRIAPDGVGLVFVAPGLATVSVLP